MQLSIAQRSFKPKKTNELIWQVQIPFVKYYEPVRQLPNVSVKPYEPNRQLGNGVLKLYELNMQV